MLGSLFSLRLSVALLPLALLPVASAIPSPPLLLPAPPPLQPPSPPTTAVRYDSCTLMVEANRAQSPGIVQFADAYLYDSSGAAIRVSSASAGGILPNSAA